MVRVTIQAILCLTGVGLITEALLLQLERQSLDQDLERISRPIAVVAVPPIAAAAPTDVTFGLPDDPKWRRIQDRWPGRGVVIAWTSEGSAPAISGSDRLEPVNSAAYPALGSTRSGDGFRLQAAPGSRIELRLSRERDDPRPGTLTIIPGFDGESLKMLSLDFGFARAGAAILGLLFLTAGLLLGMGRPAGKRKRGEDGSSPLSGSSRD